MATKTANKGFLKPQVGGDVNAWGGMLNGDMDSLDSLLGGTLTLPVAGSADVTLTAIQANNLNFVFTGALTGDIHVIWPAAGGFYFVTNSTSGAHSLTVLTSAGGSTGIAIPQGTSVVVMMDGVNAYFSTLPIVRTTGVVTGATFASPTFTGTVTMPDGSTITSSGYANVKALGVNTTVP